MLTQEPERFAKRFAAYDVAVSLHGIIPSEPTPAFRQWQVRTRGVIEWQKPFAVGRPRP